VRCDAGEADAGLNTDAGGGIDAGAFDAGPSDAGEGWASADAGHLDQDGGTAKAQNQVTLDVRGLCQAAPHHLAALALALCLRRRRA
jgi:hypothetical protein